MKNRKIFIICLIFGLIIVFTGCKEKIEYGSLEGKATGTIDFSEEVPEVELDNIKAEIGEEIDYTSEIEVIGSDDLSNYQISVNTTGVNTEEEGTYTATYTITYDDQTYTKQIKVSIEGDSEKSNETTTQAQTTKQVQETTNSSKETNAQTSTVTTTKSAGVPVAEIELLSGEIVSINCTVDKYIISTRTDISTITRDGVTYQVEKLIITYNTGAEQVLETVEKKIS